ncbi:MAG TPA: hypothetical protein GXX72_08685 [Clostridiaceae bacterium]|nr:hypothetical protein [Clostridiaceae bacterium]
MEIVSVWISRRQSWFKPTNEFMQNNISDKNYQNSCADSNEPATYTPLYISRFIRPGKRIFFIGIGGISMCGLAEFSHSRGVKVAGSDAISNNRTKYLKKIGIPVTTGHSRKNISDFNPDLVVYSGAVFADNPERAEAKDRNMPLVERAVFLGAINCLFDKVINVAGTNGKSSVVAMCALIMIESQLDPTVHLGAELLQFKTTIRVGSPDLLLSEACEFRKGFLNYRSQIAAVVNIVHDHIDCYPTLQDMISAFADFVTLQPEGCILLLPTFDTNILPMLKLVQQRRKGGLSTLELIWFGHQEQKVPAALAELEASEESELKSPAAGSEPNYSWCDDDFSTGFPAFTIRKNGEYYRRVQLKVPGVFNIENAMAAVALADLNGAAPEAAEKALADFIGAEGRFTYTGMYNGAKVFADYAHHPSAVRVTIEAARHIPANKLWVCYQPLTHSRVRGFFDDFVDALKDEKPIMMSEIYDDRERDTSISSKDICDAINALGGEALYFPTNEDLEAHLRTIVKPGDVLLIMGVDLRNTANILTGRTDHMKKVED